MTPPQVAQANAALDEDLAPQIGVGVRELERIAAPSADAFLRDYVRERRPVVLTGVTEGWRPEDRWSPEALAESYGDTRVLAAPLRDGKLAESRTHGVEFRHILLRDFVTSLERPGSASDYVMAPTWDFPPGLQQDYRTPLYCDGAPYMQAKVWVGKKGTVTPLHRDIPHNFHVHLYGRKRWLLYSPQQSSQVYPRSPLAALPNFSNVDPEKPDFDRHPRLRDATALVCSLGPGETLFIPSGWWHHTRSLANSVAMNFWWGGQAIFLASKVSQAFKRLRRIQRGEWS